MNHDDDLWARLAAGDNLPETVALDIWDIGSEQARRQLARRKDLPDTITDHILTAGDTTLLCEWLRTERPIAHLEQIAPRPADDADHDRILHHLAWQPALRSEHIDAIIANGTNDALRILLGRTDLSKSQRRQTAIRITTSEGDFSGKDSRLITEIGYDPQIWQAVAAQAQPAMLGTLSEAVLAINDKDLHQTFADRLLAIIDNNAEIAATFEFLRLSRLLIRSPHLPKDFYQQLAAHPLTGEIRSQLRQRAELDLAELTRTIRNCDPGRGCRDDSHLSSIRELDDAHQYVTLTSSISEKLLHAALAHSEHLDTRTYHAVLSRTTISDTTVEILEHNARHDLIADIITCQGRRWQHGHRTSASTVELLARRGASCILDGLFRPHRELTDVIVDNYQPIGDLLSEPDLAGRVAARLAALPSSHRDTAYYLLPEWSGDLTSLLQTAQEL